MRAFSLLMLHLLLLNHLQGKHKTAMNNLARWVQDELWDKAHEEVDTSCWEHEYVSWPQQEDAVSCGVFTIM